MIKFYPLVRIMLIACFTLALASIAQAQATRTWVSGVGDDLNPCSRTAPCKTWAGAISKTAVNGEIDALDPGGFGSLTVTKNITVDGTQGAGFGSTINSLVNGFIINDSATATPNTIVVTLRNLSILAPANGTNGINFTSGKTLNVEDCDIIGNTAASTNGAGIRVSLTVTGSSVNVKNTNIFKNRVGIFATTTTGSVTLNINNCNIEHNTSDGIFLDNNAFATVRNSNLAFNGGAGLSLDNNGANSATLLGTESAHNLIGVFVGTATTVRMGHSSIVQNGTNFTNSGTIVSFCNNETDSATIPGTVSTNCLK